MNFLKKIFKSKEPEIRQEKKKQKSSFLSWLCATKPQNEFQDPNGTGLKPMSIDSSGKKSIISLAQTNNTKIVQRLSFGQAKSDSAEQELKSLLITIEQKRINRIEDLVIQNGIYAMISSDQPLFELNQKSIWLKIGKNEQINSLVHIKPYYFDRVFMHFDQFGSQYSIEEILQSKQNICLRIQNKSVAQQLIITYEKQLIKNFAFKLMIECFNKVKISVIRTMRNQVWLNFNEQTSPDLFVNQIGFDKSHEEYESLKQQIPKGLTLQEYIDIIEHKEKLQSKYEGKNVGQYIKNKFLQKISRKGLSPRNDSPRTQQQQSEKDNEEEYQEYILLMTANTLPRDKLDDSRKNLDQVQKEEKKQNNSYEQEIFEFNVYKDQKQQEARRVAQNRERKKRSKSEDIFVNDLNDAPQYEESDYFDQKQ